MSTLDRRSPYFFGPRSTTLRRVSKTTAFLVFGALFLSISLFTPGWPSDPPGTEHATFWSSATSSHLDPYHHRAEEFWQQVSSVLLKHKPSFDQIELHGSPGWLTFDRHSAPPFRPSLVNLTESQLRSLKSQHSGVTSELAQLASRLPFRRGTRGIVTTANNDALTVLATSLRMLRKTGSKLPVEIMIDVWEAEPCNIVFPSLGARCIFVEHFVSGEEIPEALRFGHFGWKAAVIAFSSFEHVLYLDSDLFPVVRPDDLFKQKPFTNKGYVLWPDYWANSASHYLYEILGLDIPSMDERASTESGALLIDKSTHAAAVLQSLYYNLYGDKHYYPLFSQGASGFGDKESWIAASQVHALPFYQVVQPPARIGYTCEGTDRAIASCQHHPGDDYSITISGARSSARSSILDTPTPRPLFVHGNLPKYDSADLLSWDMPDLGWQDMLRCDKNQGKAHRLWGPKEMTLARFGWDVEKALWDSMRWVACEHETAFAIWNNGSWHSRPRHNVCERVVEFYEELMTNETYDASLEPSQRQSPTNGWTYWPA